MKYIRKHASPTEFEAWKIQENPQNWDVLQSFIPEERREEGLVYYSKQQLRELLLTEQGYLCCYCTQEIDHTPKTTIEHLFPQAEDEDKGKIFDYMNLLACCNGGEQDPKPRQQHCGLARGSKPLLITPLMPDCESYFMYDQEGHILPTTSEAKQTIEILQLDIPKLKNLREIAISQYVFVDEDKRTLISPEDAKLLINRLQQRDQYDKFKPFCVAIMNILRQIS